MNHKQMEMCSFQKEQNSEDSIKDIIHVPIGQLHDFKGHPFKVERYMALFELMQSIGKEGVIVPALVRPNPYGEGYEMIAGHRRNEACLWAGIGEMPVVVRNLDDNQAVIAMVDSNLQREYLKPSEKTFAYNAKIVEVLGKYDPDRTHFIHDICATAKGYEYYCYMILRKKSQQQREKR